ncbi:ssu-2 homolog, tandem duplicate 2 [Brachyhypopomus gauderio]|uniref:ssu-2 homolog, tandem duplicate 2 n=1 Tax=Brachyhypopomus gauderio TaxID=698409 RepID=UPI004041C31F
MDKLHLLSNQDETATGPPSHPPTAPDAGPFKDGASAPPVELMPEAGACAALIPEYSDAPPPPLGYLQQSPANSPDWHIPAISEELAREVFIEFASRKCCYSTKPSKEMVFTDMHALNTYRYRLETFTESRSTEWASEPYNGQLVDGLSGVAPGPWDMVVPVPALFKDCKRDIRIPHTSSVKGCDSCLNLGRSACARCVNSGRIQCQICGGSGRSASNGRCHHCTGHGRIMCAACGGVGSTTCMKCQGRGRILSFILLKIKWKNNEYTTMVDKRSGFPVDLLHSVTGEMLFTDMNKQVYPIVNFPEGAVNSASASAVQEHQAQFSTTCRIVQQRQTIELIPVTRVHFAWREKTHIYFVYGAENKVFTKDYPARCCCCSIS